MGIPEDSFSELTLAISLDWFKGCKFEDNNITSQKRCQDNNERKSTILFILFGIFVFIQTIILKLIKISFQIACRVRDIEMNKPKKKVFESQLSLL